MSFSFMFSSNKENRFYTKYMISTTVLVFFPVTVSIIKHTLMGRLIWSGVHIETRKQKHILFKITGNSQLSHAKKVLISISLCITWKFRLSKHGQCVTILHKHRWLQDLHTFVRCVQMLNKEKPTTYFRTEKVLLRRQGEGRLVYKSSGKLLQQQSFRTQVQYDVPFSYTSNTKTKTPFILN